LGYPTANVSVDAGLDVANGVYAATVDVDGRSYKAVANLGVKPTFRREDAQDAQRLLELHLLDFEGDLYGRTITAELLEYIRPERRFASPEALKAQIATDEKIIKNILKCI
jgi:FAD synthase